MNITTPSTLVGDPSIPVHCVQTKNERVRLEIIEEEVKKLSSIPKYLLKCSLNF